MILNIISENEHNIAIVQRGSVYFKDLSDLLDLMAEAACSDAQRIIIYEDQLPSEFFDLKTGIAGEMLQKFSNYRAFLAIVGNYSKYKSKSLHDFIRESNQTSRIIFANSLEEARKLISK